MRTLGSPERSKRPRRFLSLAAVVVLVAACGSQATTPSPATSAPSAAPATAAPATAAPPPTEAPSAAAGATVLTVFSDWTGADQSNLEKIVAAFAKESGIQVELSGTTDFLPVLQTRIASGNAPMVAIVPRPGVIADFVSQDLAKPLDAMGVDLAGNYGQGVIDLGSVNGKPYGLIVKANSKSLVYYNPKRVPGNPKPATWTDFKALLDQRAATGIKPLVISEKDGWTFGDWFENIYMRMAGPDKYQDLFTGKVPFTDPSVAVALQEMMAVVRNEKYVTGGLQVAQSTGYNDGLAMVFGTKPTGDFYLEGGFTTLVVTSSVNTAIKPGEDMAFFQLPAIDSAIGDQTELGADFAIAFTDNDATKAFMQFLAKPETSTMWAEMSVISPNKNVDASKYPNTLISQEAALIAGATSARFDGTDQMPGDLGGAWEQTLQGIYADPTQMDSLLKSYQDHASTVFGG
jgi:alpha-glucoside transport system substrate-binding protein